jgi:hypothetical protein
LLNRLDNILLTLLWTENLYSSYRCHHREQIAADIKWSFDPSVSLIIHCDGKIWRALTKIRKPGTCHRARWMAKIIYCLKMFLFRLQFELKKTEVLNLKNFTLFIIWIYLKVWYTSTDASGAPLNDLNFLKYLNKYGNSSNGIYKLALKVFSGHLWYLSDTLTGLEFLDFRVSDDIKLKIVKNFDKIGTDNLDHRVNYGFELVTARVVANCETFAPHYQRLVWATLNEKRRHCCLNLSGNDCNWASLCLLYNL